MAFPYKSVFTSWAHLRCMSPKSPFRYAFRDARTLATSTNLLNLAPPRNSEFSQSVPAPNDEIIVAMSGGVDSSVTAALYASRYKNVRGIYMANWSQTAKCTEADWNDVQRVCRQLGIPCERVNFEKDYWNDVFSPMIEMYQQGLTPNPDLGCNRHIKFGRMVDYLKATRAQNFSSDSEVKTWFATGHYARVVKNVSDSATGETGAKESSQSSTDDDKVTAQSQPETILNQFSLAQASEPTKDQSYYLASISRAVLPHILMPLGHYRKSEVRALARDTFHLHTAAKPDSVGLCFVSPDHTKFRDFLNEYIPPNPGNIVTEDGKVWGQHQGLWHATIGQKSGIPMPQGSPEYKGVWFVSEKRVNTNEIVIVRGRDNEALYRKGVIVTDWLWFGSSLEDLSELSDISMRYQSLHTPVAIEALERISTHNYRITLQDKQRAMAPGQNVVLYSRQRVLASGQISSTF